MSYRVLDPTSETDVAGVTIAPRLGSLAGKTVGFISNGKEGTKGFFSHLERLLHEEFQVAQVVYTQKGNFSAPAEAAIIEGVGAWDAAVTGLGD